MGSSFVLTKKQKAILIGSLLGDASIELRWKNARARFGHSIKQKDYIFYKYNVFKNIATAEPKLIYHREHRQTHKRYTSFYFSTIAFSELNLYRQYFYDSNGKKIVPKDIEKLLKDPISLAIWIMDDGYKRNDCDALRINTEAFSLFDQKRLIKCLRNNFDLKAALHRKYNWWNIYIPHSEMKKLRSLISAHIIPSLFYKICPVTTYSVL